MSCILANLVHGILLSWLLVEFASVQEMAERSLFIVLVINVLATMLFFFGGVYTDI
jgi:hypothetical protein